MKARKKIKRLLHSLVICALALSLSGEITAQVSFHPKLEPAEKEFTIFVEESSSESSPPALYSLLRPIRRPVSHQFSRVNGYEAFFCRMEWKWEKQTELPVKFRLGSYEYTNWLEGKALRPVSQFQ